LSANTTHAQDSLKIKNCDSIMQPHFGKHGYILLADKRISWRMAANHLKMFPNSNDELHKSKCYRSFQFITNGAALLTFAAGEIAYANNHRHNNSFTNAMLYATLFGVGLNLYFLIENYHHLKKSFRFYNTNVCDKKF
jgi:hypothetical protein